MIQQHNKLAKAKLIKKVKVYTLASKQFMTKLQHLEEEEEVKQLGLYNNVKFNKFNKYTMIAYYKRLKL